MNSTLWVLTRRKAVINNNDEKYEFEEAQREMTESFIETLLMLKENYGHLDNEFVYDLDGLITEYEERI